jgi:hypothetical protein
VAAGQGFCSRSRSYIPAAYDALSFFFRLTDTSIKLFMPPAAESVNNKNEIKRGGKNPRP